VKSGLWFIQFCKKKTHTQQNAANKTPKYFFEVEGSVGRLHRKFGSFHDMARHIDYM